MRFYQVDAFTDTVFKGNPAAVCVSDSWLSDDIMLKLAIENNLSETAFAVGRDGRYGLRWFTPGGEIDLCGHATLATAFTIMNHVEPGITHVDFDTASGHLGVDREGDEYTLDFPLIRTSEYTPEDDIGDAIGCEPVCCAIGYRDPIAMLPTDRDVIDLHPDITKIMNLKDGLGLFITAPGSGEYDFVSRAFWPKINVPEDPVCGSMHCSLADFWSKRLNKTKMLAYEASPRGGVVGIEIVGDRVRLSGKAVLFATFEVDDGILMR